MYSDLLMISLAFTEGFALILSPCILPVLPLFLAGSITQSNKRALGIILGFIASFTLFSLISRQLLLYSGLSLTFIRIGAYSLLFTFGCIMLIPALSVWFQQATQFITQWIHPRTKTATQGFWSGLLLGSLLAIVWTPCAGPIFAAIIVQIALQKTNMLSVFILCSFALGACLPMAVIAFYARVMQHGVSFFKTHALLIRQLLGALVILSTALMWAQEKGLLFNNFARGNKIIATSLQQGLWHPYPAPEIIGIDKWLNSAPLSLEQLKNKVVLIDFWTYSCINCIRTLPYLNDWYKKYHDQGLEIIGIHTPEFAFEKNSADVQRAIKAYGIHYPVALDNQYVMWQQYSNHYWPAHYLINKQGKVVYEHKGEGAYAVTENNIRYLLGIDRDEPDFSSFAAGEGAGIITPELYLGYKRADKTLSPLLYPKQIRNYHFSDTLSINHWDLDGSWQVDADRIVAMKAGASLQLHFNARTVYMVMGTQAPHPTAVNIVLDSKPQSPKHIIVRHHQLYTITQSTKQHTSIVQIIAQEPGLEIYTITFGG